MKFVQLTTRWPRLARLTVSVLSVGLLSACSVAPVPLTEQQVRDRLYADQMKIYMEQEQIFKAISFEEALARALKYNLDYRLKQMESALSVGLSNLARYDMLPNLLLSAGYANRNNDSGGNSVDINTGAVSLSNSTSQERHRQLGSAEFSWNILDFGVSYFRAKQQSDQYLIAEERRRRVIQNILQDTRSAYWRAAGAQRLVRQAESLNERVQSALARSREAETQGLLPPKEALSYQRLLLDAVQLLNARRQELEFAKRELAALMNVTPGTDFTVQETEEPPLIPVPFNVAELEEIALTNRPELREEDLRVRITADEARRQLLTLLPGISLNVGDQYDSNKYLYNNNWVDSGLRVTFNLLKVLSLPAMNDVHQAQIRADEARRLALSMAILTQVRVSIERYRLAVSDLEIARESNVVDQRLAAYAQAALSTRADTELELIRAETRALNSEYQRYSAYAAAQSAFGRIYNSLGLDVLPDNLESDSIANLARAVAAHIDKRESETFSSLASQGPRLPAMRLVIELPRDARDVDSKIIYRAVENALKRNRIKITEKTENSPLLTMKLVQEPIRDGVRKAYWDLELIRADGSLAGHAHYASSLPDMPSARVITAFAEAANIANLKQLAMWLEEPLVK